MEKKIKKSIILIISVAFLLLGVAFLMLIKNDFKNVIVLNFTKETYSQLIPQNVLQNVIDKDPSAKLFEISKGIEEERYTFVGKEVFQIIISNNSDQVGFNTVAHLSPKNFKKYKTLKNWNIDYNSAKAIAQNISESFDGKFNELGYLNDKPIMKYCGGGLVPVNNPTIPHANPYWTFSRLGNYSFYSVYIDAVDGKIIYTCKGYFE